MKPHESSFAQFAEAVRPTGAVNRFPQIGDSHEKTNYQIYLNGDMVSQLPEDTREHVYSDVLIHSFTEKMGLNPELLRDKLKVAEMLAVHESYMTMVLHASTIDVVGEKGLAEHVIQDYELLAKEGLNHPWIQQEISKQKERSLMLKPALEQASEFLGKPVADRYPDEFNSGRVVAQNAAYTVQEIQGGHAVTHDNDSLSVLPQLGENVVIMYYRGHGQVFENVQQFEVSAPYLDAESNDLALRMQEKGGQNEQVIMFSGIVSFQAFVKEQGLPQELIVQGMETLASKPKLMPKERPIRVPVSALGFDDSTGAITLEYQEGAIKYTALFNSAEDIERLAPNFSLTERDVSRAKFLEDQHNSLGPNNILRVARLNDSFNSAVYKALEMSDDVMQANDKTGRYAGLVVANTNLHVIQDAGRGSLVIHSKTSLDKVPEIGQRMSVSYKDGRGAVVDRSANRSLSH